ncbi:MAG: TRAP transporter substrate-binding protein [Clostridia bacterium]|jgi:tripartite ATP-independent transporter DctP family solute receptor|nr:TRAP transporter substrate-binding protein [Clostridia bacterium]MCI1999317.1 TRAP transporter substrate-binding protein [Clostridia bacterium]MCI2015181.1 TRAP transporter substrate-binding protein [Clostridia bacterium]
MKKKVLGVIIASALLAASLAGCGSSSAASSNAAAAKSGASSQASGKAEFAMIAGTTLPDAHPYNLGLKKMGELVDQKTNGAVTLDVFGNSQLGSERDLIEGLQLGSVQVTCVSTAPLAGFTDSFLVFDLPFIFETTEQARAVMDSDVGNEILHSVDDQGIVGLAWFENGFRNVTNNKKPINTPDDLKGMKIRTMENQMHMAAFQAMGADPTPMAMGDVFTALQQGTIDGEENPVPIVDTNKFSEVQKYISLTGHLFSPAPVFMAKDYYDSMSEDYQKAVQEAATEAAPYERDQIDKQNATGLDDLKAAGMQVNEPEKAPFKKATASIYDEYVKDGSGMVSPDIYNKVEEIVKAHPATDSSSSTGSSSSASSSTAE